MTKKKQSFLYGSAVLMGSMLVVKVVGALFKIPLTNLIGITGMGYFNSAYNIYTVFYALTVSGLSSAVARVVAENSAAKRYRDVRRIFKIAFLIFFVLGIAGFLTIVVSAKPFVQLIHSPNSFWAVLMIAPSIFFCCIMAAYRGYYEGLSDMRPTAVTQVVEVFSKMAAGLILSDMVMKEAGRQFAINKMVFGVLVSSREAAVTAALPYAAAGAMLGVSISTLMGFLYIFLNHRVNGDGITAKELSESPPKSNFSFLVKKIFHYAVPITLGAVVLQLSTLIDTVTLQNRLLDCCKRAPEYMYSQFGSYLKEKENIPEMLYGCFTTCAVLFNLVPAFTGIFGKSALPGVTAAWVTRNQSELKKNIESVICITSMTAAPLAFGMAFLAGPILNLLYGVKEPRAALLGTSLLSLLAISSLLVAYLAPFNAIFQGIGRMKLPLYYLCAGAAVKCVCNLIFVGIPSLNVQGGAYGTLICYLLIFFLSIKKLKAILPVSLSFSRILLKPVLAGFFCGISAKMSFSILSRWGSGSMITLFSILIGAVFYLFFLGVFKIVSKNDVKLLPNGKKITKVLEILHFIR